MLSQFACDRRGRPAQRRRQTERRRGGLPLGYPGRSPGGCAPVGLPSRYFRCSRRRRSQEFARAGLPYKEVLRPATSIQAVGSGQDSAGWPKTAKAKAPNRSFTSCTALLQTNFALVKVSQKNDPAVPSCPLAGIRQATI